MFSSEECNYFCVILDYVDFQKIYLNNEIGTMILYLVLLPFIHTNVSPHHFNRKVSIDGKPKLFQLFPKG